MLVDYKQEDGRIDMHISLMHGPLDGQRFAMNNPPDEISLPLYVFKNREMSNVFMDSKKTWYYEHKLPNRNYCSAPKAIGKAIYRHNFRIKEEKGKIIEKYYTYVRSEKIEEVEKKK